MRYSILLFITTCTIMCQNKSSQSNVDIASNFDIEGHRGCRGLMPENTLPAFQKALDLGVNTLELDLAVSKDKHLVVSHEPYFRAGLSIDPTGQPVTKDEELNHNIYQMTYDTVKMYDVGSLPDARYPEKENIKTFKPLLSEVVNKAEHFSFIFNKTLPDFNIEIKRSPEYDGIYHPEVGEFVDIVLRDVKDMDILEYTIIQSFDLEALRLVKAKEPRVRTALLIENTKDVNTNLEELGFKPDIYSCYFKLLTQESIDYCHSKNIKVIPWTVNEVADMRSLIDLGVDGIITDYPDRLIAIVRG